MTPIAVIVRSRAEMEEAMYIVGMKSSTMWVDYCMRCCIKPEGSAIVTFQMPCSGGIFYSRYGENSGAYHFNTCKRSHFKLVCINELRRIKEET